MQARKIIIGLIAAIILLLIDVGIAFYTHSAVPTQTAETPQTITPTIATTSTRVLTPDVIKAVSNPDGSLNTDRLRAYLASSSTQL